MYQVENHPLVEFVYHTFGSSFADLVMVGYNEEPTKKKKIFHLNEEIGGRGFEWVIEAVGNSLPSHQEPLVIAGLLKILLRGSLIFPHLEFNVNDLIEELGWEDDPLRHKEIDRIISNYANLSFHKEPKNKRCEGAGLRWGQYSLITAYLRETVRASGGASFSQTSRRIEVAPSFVQGLKRGQVYFADINFGQIKM